MKKFFKFDKQDPTVVHIINQGKEPYVMTDGQSLGFAISALWASMSFFKFDAYGHPDTEIGLHFYKTPDPTKIVKKIGWVSANYFGVQNVPVPTLDRYPTGWAPIKDEYGMRKLGGFSLNAVEKHNGTPYNMCEHAMNARRKHIVIDFLLDGHDLTLGFGAMKEEGRIKMFDKFQAVWNEKNLEKALALSLDQMWESVNFSNTSGKNWVRKQQIEAGTAEPLTPEVIQTTDDNVAVLAMKVVETGKTINLFELPMGIYGLADYKGRGNHGTPWDPDSPLLVEDWAGYVKEGYQIRLK